MHRCGAAAIIGVVHVCGRIQELRLWELRRSWELRRKNLTIKVKFYFFKNGGAVKSCKILSNFLAAVKFKSCKNLKSS